MLRTNGYIKNLKASNATAIFISTLLVSIFIIATLNFVIDPGQIYLLKIRNEQNSANLGKTLFKSKYGIVQSGWGERTVKTNLARHAAEFDCVIIGSSHVMQFSSVRNMSINNKCTSFLNLGVSGGALEDIAIFSYLVTDSLFKPNNVFIAIDPWTIKMGMDGRWAENESIYTSMMSRINLHDNGLDRPYIYKKITNLINYDYLKSSLESLKKNGLLASWATATKSSSLLNQPILAEEFDFEEGFKDPVTLPDGSHAYEADFIRSSRIKPIPMGGGDYKISGPSHTDDGITLLLKIIKVLRSDGVEVSFIMTPYHENVFLMGETETVKHIREVSSVVLKLSQKHNIPIYGSFYPNELKCTANEFFDFMHPKSSCLNKIVF